MRRGPCGGEVDGEYEETFTLTLKPRGEGLGGTAKQRFGGCDGDKRVSATYRLTADPLDEPLPYPDAETAEAVTDALNEIDPLAEDLNSAYTACFKPSASAATVTACKAKAFRTWLDAAPAAVAAVTDISATAACGKAVAAVKPDKSVAAVRKAEVVNRRVADGGPSAGIDDVDAAAGSAVGDLYAALVRVGTMCTPPQDYAELGRDGVMTIDARSSYIPPLEG